MKWLILRGLVREQRHWGDFPEKFETELKTQDPQSKVHMIDFPGFGTEANRPSPFSIDEIVDDLRARFSLLKEKSNDSWGLLALSLGGMVAMNWTARYPKDFDRLVLVNSSATGVSPIHQRMKPRNYTRILSLFAERNIAIREQKILEMTTNLKGEALRERARRHAEFALKVKRKDAFAQIFAAIRFRPPVQIDIPILVLGAEGDTLVDVACSRAIAKRYGADLCLHETSNHDLPTDDPIWMVHQIHAWANAQAPVKVMT